METKAEIYVPLVPRGVKGGALAAWRGRTDDFRRGELAEPGVNTGESPLRPFLEDALSKNGLATAMNWSGTRDGDDVRHVHVFGCCHSSGSVQKHDSDTW